MRFFHARCVNSVTATTTTTTATTSNNNNLKTAAEQISKILVWLV
jgi:hypothetical protein